MGSIMPSITDLDIISRGNGWYTGTMIERHKQFSYLKKGAFVAHFDSVRTFFEAYPELNWKPAREESSDKRNTKKRDGFNAFGSLAEAVEVFGERPSTIRQFTPEDIQLKSDESIGRDVTFDVTGDYLDIGRYLEGQPECFGVAYNGNPTGLYVTLYVDVVANFNIHHETILRKQQRVLRLADWLEQQGVRCKIIATWSNVCGHFSFNVKDYGDPVNLNDVAVTMHPEFMRRILFLACEQSKTWEYGYGSTLAWTEAMRHSYAADPEDGLTVFVSCQMNGRTEHVDNQFDRLRDKIEALLTGEGKDTVAGEETLQRDFTKVYSVEL